MNQSQSTTTREISELELNLDKCDRYLQEPFYLEDTSSLEDILREAHSHLKLLADAFVPASLTDDEASDVLDRLLEVKKKLRSREKDARAILDDVTQVKLRRNIMIHVALLLYNFNLIGINRVKNVPNFHAYFR